MCTVVDGWIAVCVCTVVGGWIAVCVCTVVDGGIAVCVYSSGWMDSWACPYLGRAVGQPDQDETAPPDPTGHGVDHPQAERRGHSRVHGVTSSQSQ